jgi:ATP-binding protein involved in chromosome partitioning
MPLNIRTYHDLTEADRSGLGAQVGAQRRRVAERLAPVQRIVAVMSGKGGVGKSVVTASLARSLARAGRRVGALDADLNGPTLARLLAAAGPLAVTAGAVEPVIGADGVRCVSMAHVLEDGKPLAFKGPDNDAFIWRGALEAAALRELLGDVAWGALDVLLVDLPPGIGRFHELADLLPAPPDVVTVTIPTVESADAVRRALQAARDRGARLVGVIENMSGGAFAGDAGDVLAREFAIPLLARIPFNPGDAVWQELGARL